MGFSLRIGLLFSLTIVVYSDEWCKFGTVLRGEVECLCNKEGENSCVGPKCGSGYGTSFFPKSCTTCKCLDPKGAGIYAKPASPASIHEPSGDCGSTSPGMCSQEPAQPEPRPADGRGYGEKRRAPPADSSASTASESRDETDPKVMAEFEEYMAWKDSLAQRKRGGDNKTLIVGATSAFLAVLMMGGFLLLRSTPPRSGGQQQNVTLDKQELQKQAPQQKERAGSSNNNEKGWQTVTDPEIARKMNAEDNAEAPSAAELDDLFKTDSKEQQEL